MTPTDRAQYQKLAAELAGIATRLKEIYDGTCAEGSPIKPIYKLYSASESVAKASLAIREEAEK